MREPWNNIFADLQLGPKNGKRQLVLEHAEAGYRIRVRLV
jgi:hypothetical protein